MPPSLRPLISKIPTIARVPNRSVLSVAGSQAAEYLNGVVSTLVKPPPLPLYCAFLHPQGRITHDVFIYTHTGADGKQGYLIDFDNRESEAPPLLPTLRRHVLRSRVKLRDVSEEYDVWGAWGSETDSVHAERQWRWSEQSGVAEPQWSTSEAWPWGTKDGEVTDARAPGMGRRLLVRKGDTPAEQSSHELGSSDAYTLHRILHGVPEGVDDMPPMQSFPMDSNLDFMGGVDFRKGCYVGQELTVRTYHKGVIRKRIMPVSIHPANDPPHDLVVPNPSAPSLSPGLEIRAAVTQTDDSERKPRARGHSRLLSSTHGVGLALMRLEQVEKAENGDLGFQIETEIDGKNEILGVSPWRPEWWPTPP
ncbi:unnamed protein product [Mycena citricolor]|uniref:CAF17 C-terminal domain-containing protein n=1 Tax=Mycena citricolor TaxID=2018698 RepID=A0AAD2HIQ5_9AGAR|nr:unnamed protein product [Mycena citricolor]